MKYTISNYAVFSLYLKKIYNITSLVTDPPTIIPNKLCFEVCLSDLVETPQNQLLMMIFVHDIY